MAKVNEKKTETSTADSSSANFKRGKALVVPTLSIKDMQKGQSLFIRFVSEPVTKQQTGKGGAPKLDPDTQEPLTITTAQVIDLTTGAIGELVLSFMVCKGLAPLGAITGRGFELVKGGKSGRTTLWEVYTLED